ncbi:MAG: hypothetical protein ACOZCL_14275 [Bacillota bacterium]
MISNIRFRDTDINCNIEYIFKKDIKIKYKKKLAGKVRLYISEKNAVKGLSGILSLYRRELH